MAPETASPDIMMRDVTGYAVPENVRLLEDMQERIFDELSPSTHLGAMFAEEIAMLTWEIDMYRKAKAAVLRLTMLNQMTEHLPEQNSGVTVGPTAQGLDDGRRRRVDEFLRGRLEQREVTELQGQMVRRREQEIDAMAAAIEQLGAIDALVAKAEYRRYAAYQQFRSYEDRPDLARAVQPVAP